MQRYCISSCLSPVIVIHYSDRRRGRGVISSSLLSRIKDSRIRQSIDPRSSFFVSLWPPRARLVTHSSSHCKSKKIEKESIAFPVRISRRIFGINSFESNREIYLSELIETKGNSLCIDRGHLVFLSVVRFPIDKIVASISWRQEGSHETRVPCVDL